MPKRILRFDDDPILRKKSKPIKEINSKVEALAQDLVDTLALESGVGLAAPQVGVLKQIIVVNFDDEEYEEIFKDGPIVAINPKILEQEGSVTETEACLSFPEQFGKVERPKDIKVKYQNLNGETITNDFHDMVARCFCHEIDHLNGIVFLDHVIEGTLNTIPDDEEA